MRTRDIQVRLGAGLNKSGFVLIWIIIGALLAMPMGMIAIGGLIAMFGFAAFCLARPGQATSVVLVGLVIVPQYFILYLPGVPALPLSLAPLGVLTGVLICSALSSPTPLMRPHSFLITAFVLYGCALAIAAVVGGGKESLMLLLRAGLIPLMLFLVCLYYAPSGEQSMRAMNWLLAAACIAALFACVEFVLQRNPLLERLVINADIPPDLKEPMSQFYLGAEAFDGSSLIYRCFSFFCNPLEFGTFMTMVYPFALVHAVTSVNSVARRRYALAAVICAVGVILSFSRGPILAMVLSTIGMAICLPRLRHIVALAGVAGLFGLGALWPFIGDRIQARLNEIDNVTARFKLWEVGFREFTDHPLFGVGLSEFAKYQDQTIRVHGIGPFVEYGGNIDKIGTVDNHFIQMAAETGLIGILSYGILLTAFFSALWRIWHRHPDPFARNSALALAAGGFNYLFNGLTITSYVLFVITMTFTFFMAAGAALAGEVKK